MVMCRTMLCGVECEYVCALAPLAIYVFDVMVMSMSEHPVCDMCVELTMRV